MVGQGMHVSGPPLDLPRSYAGCARHCMRRPEARGTASVRQRSTHHLMRAAARDSAEAEFRIFLQHINVAETRPTSMSASRRCRSTCQVASNFSSFWDPRTSRASGYARETPARTARGHANIGHPP